VAGLFFWGVLDYAVRKTGLSFELVGCVDTAFFYYIAGFFIFKWKSSAQILVCVGLLLLTEILYRLPIFPVLNQPFADQHNFGNYIDLALMNNQIRGWVAYQLHSNGCAYH
jgi:hypothetical protein